MEPLDSYRQKNVSGSRLFELFDDRVVVSGYEAFSPRFKRTVPLVILEPTVIEFRLRSHNDVVGFINLMIGGWGAFSWRSHPPIYMNPGFWVCGSFAMIGLCLMLTAIRDVDAASFIEASGQRRRLTIARSGPDKGRYQDFVERMASQIRLCRAARLASEVDGET
jgi:hypothetical protein